MCVSLYPRLRIKMLSTDHRAKQDVCQGEKCQKEGAQSPVTILLALLLSWSTQLIVPYKRCWAVLTDVNLSSAAPPRKCSANGRSLYPAIWGQWPRILLGCHRYHPSLRPLGTSRSRTADCETETRRFTFWWDAGENHVVLFFLET